MQPNGCLLFMQPSGCIFLAGPSVHGPEPKEHEMADIRHRVGIDTSAESVYQALATRNGGEVISADAF